MTKFYRKIFIYETARYISWYNWLRSIQFTQMIWRVEKGDVLGWTTSTSPQYIRLIIFKMNGTLVKKQKYVLQISVREIHNDNILPILQGDSFGARIVDNKLFIGYAWLRSYMPKYIKPTSNRNKITCEYKTCLIAMLFQSYLNKGRWSKFPKLISYILILYQLDFNKYLRLISLNKRIEYFQTIHI